MLTAADRLKAAQKQRAAQTGINPYATVEAGEVLHDLSFYQEQMERDKAYIVSLPTLEEKKAAKLSRLSGYRAFISNYKNHTALYPDKVAVRLMIWLFDVSEIEPALKLALILIQQGIHKMPRNFDRDIPTFVCDELYDWAALLLKNEQSASPYLDELVAIMDHDQWSLSPPVQSKMYALLAKHKAREGQWQSVSVLCAKAQAVNPEGHGTKTLSAQAALKQSPQAQCDADSQ